MINIFTARGPSSGTKPNVKLGSWEISHLNLFPFPHWFGCPGINCMLAPPPSTWVGSLQTSTHFPFHLLLRKSPHGVRIQWSWKRDDWKFERNCGLGFGSGWEFATKHADQGPTGLGVYWWQRHCSSSLFASEAFVQTPESVKEDWMIKDASTDVPAIKQTSEMNMRTSTTFLLPPSYFTDFVKRALPFFWEL